MKKQLLFLCITALGLMSFVIPIQMEINQPVASGIHFEDGNWKQALALAKKENKLVYLNIHATWCGPCKRMKRKTFSAPDVGNYYNSNFINISLDGEKGEGIPLSEKYNVDSYPSHIFVDGDGKLVVLATGYHSHKGFIKVGEAVLMRYNKAKK